MGLKKMDVAVRIKKYILVLWLRYLIGPRRLKERTGGRLPHRTG